MLPVRPVCGPDAGENSFYGVSGAIRRRMTGSGLGSGSTCPGYVQEGVVSGVCWVCGSLDPLRKRAEPLGIFSSCQFAHELV